MASARVSPGYGCIVAELIPETRDMVESMKPLEGRTRLGKLGTGAGTGTGIGVV
jgi:hypothetical protein